MTRDLLPLTSSREGSKGFGDSVELALVVEEFARHKIHSIITTDDGSIGSRGYVTNAPEYSLNSPLASGHTAPRAIACSPARRGSLTRAPRSRCGAAQHGLDMPLRIG